MKIAVAVTEGRISGPGEADDIMIFDSSDLSKPLESYGNPAITAVSARGIVMLKSVMDHGAEKLIISGIGDHAMQYASDRLELLSGSGMALEQALERFSNGSLGVITGATHHSSHTHSH